MVEAPTSSSTTSRPTASRASGCAGLAGAARTVPVLVEDGAVSQVGWQGRGCMVSEEPGMTSACTVRVRGVVQGVGFRPFVFRLARANTLAGWVLNGGEGVEIQLEGDGRALERFLRDLERRPPPAASIAAIDVEPRSRAVSTNS